ncbi:MAG: hypothetical protein KC502_23495 [Myxococcales bacterium]|nr:hypothetical protein [Myxococcales bacterium]
MSIHRSHLRIIGTWLTRPALAVLLATAVCLTAGCSSDEGDGGGMSCTAMGCADSYGVDFGHTGAWPAGDYQVSVSLDGSDVVCSATLPFASCETSGACVGGSESVLLIRSGCALDKAQHKLGGIIITGAQPKEVKVSVTRGGKAIGDGSWTPTFVTSRPNGPNCGPVCNQAPKETLTLK